jgi:hypothetical protein
MPSPSPVADALAFLQQKRAELVAAHEAAIAPVDEAIRALSGLASSNGIAPPPVVSPPQVVSAPRPSVRSMLMALLNERDQDWSTDEILSEYKSRGTPVHGKNPNLALRAAIADSFKADEIVRTTRGRYKAAKFVDATPASDDGQAVPDRDSGPEPPEEEPF